VLVCVSVALTLTVLAVLLDVAVVPPTGLVRTVYPEPGFTGQPLLQDRTADISLAFLDDNPRLPRRLFSARWKGYWFLPKGRSFDLYAGADDRVEVLVDDKLVLRRDSDVGTSTDRRRITLAAGPHALEVRYEQYRGGYMLNFSRARAGETPGAFQPTRLFPEPPDATDYWLARALRWTYRVVAVVWLVPLILAAVILSGRSEVRAWAPPSLRLYARRMFRVAFPALLGPLVLFVVGPHTLYEANRSEFDVAFAALAWPWLLAAAGIGWALLLAIGGVVSLLSERLGRSYVALLLAFGLLLWIQGTFLVPDYGPLLGEGLDLSRYAWRAPYEAGLWIAGLSLAVVFAKAVSSIAPLVSQLFVGLQVVALAGSLLWPAAQVGSGSDGWSQPPDEMYQLSRQKNVIQIVLDGFLSEVFDEAVAQDRSSMDRDFPGFVFFADHLGAFPTTRGSMPAMLTGVAYRNQMPFDRFLRETTWTQSISTVLGTHGFAIHSISFDGRDHPRTRGEEREHIVRYNIPTPYASYRDYVGYAALQLVDLSLFRHVPEGLKSYVYNDQEWLAQDHSAELGVQTERARNVRPSNHAAFLDEFAGRMTVTQDQPVYTFIHVAIPHPPIALDADCSFLGIQPLTRNRYAGQARCSLLVVRHLLDRLRALDVYDRSVVVVVGDHGWQTPRPDHPFRGLSSPGGDMEDIVLSAMPLLAIKRAGATGPLRVSYAPTAITDVPATIVDLAGLPNSFPGESVFKIDEDAVRPRTYAFHTWVNADWGRQYLDALELYSIKGRVLDPSAWTYLGEARPPSATRGAGGRAPQRMP